MKKILITAGPTREMLDPVRFISNLSTGLMGYEIARQAKRKGYQVTLISGPVCLKKIPGIRTISIASANELKRVCENEFTKHQALIMTAAVCDFVPVRKQAKKIHRRGHLTLKLKKTPDILAGLCRKKGGRIVIGFCLETERWLENAEKKIHQKKLDGIVANYIKGTHIPFGDQKIQTAFIDDDGNVKRLRRMSKGNIAAKVLNWLEELSE